MTIRSLLGKRRAGVAMTVGATAALTAALAPLHDHVGLLNAGLIYLLVTLVVAGTWGWQTGLFAGVLANLTFNFFFVPPRYTLTVEDPKNAFALVVFLIVSLIGGFLLASARAAAAEARLRAAETEVLLRLSRTLIGQTEPQAALDALCHEVVNALKARGASVLRATPEGWQVLAAAGGDAARRAPDTEERAMANRAAAERTAVMLGYTGLASTRDRKIRLPSGSARRLRDSVRAIAFVPLSVGDQSFGVLRLDGPTGETPFRDEPQRLLAPFAAETALAVQRVEMSQAASRVEALKEADEMKSALMASISHDLKTPLAGIKTAVSSLLDGSVRWSQSDITEFLNTIDSQTDRLNHLLSDILELNRLEAGAIRPSMRRINGRDLIVEATNRTEIITAGRRVVIDARDDLTVRGDESLLVQALVNLIENAAKHSVAGGTITVSALRNGVSAEFSVADEGPGLLPDDVPHVFERFYRGHGAGTRTKGSGLGLAIVKGFVGLSNGTVRIENSSRGARFVITLALDSTAPQPVSRHE